MGSQHLFRRLPGPRHTPLKLYLQRRSRNCCRHDSLASQNSENLDRLSPGAKLTLTFTSASPQTDKGPIKLIGDQMNILLLSMPDSFEHMPAAGVRMPNGALSPLAGNVDSHHQVAVADLILVQRRVRETLVQLVKQLQPDLVGLSIMTFQRKTAKAIIDLIRALKPNVQVVVGGYDPTLATQSYHESGPGQGDFIVRGEGEITFRDLLRAIESSSPYDHIAGLSYRVGDHFQHNRERPISGLEKSEIRPPKRSARVLSGYTMLGRQIDVIETSRGCTFDCSFCSIVEMRGRNFETFSFDRVIADIRDAYDYGARSIFIVDDNITLNVKRFAGLCEAIIAAGLNWIDYSVQGMAWALAKHGGGL